MAVVTKQGLLANFSCVHKCLRYIHRASNANITSTWRTMKAKKHSSQLWLKRHHKDPFVKQARVDNYRCRSAYKLIDMDDRFHLFKPGSVIIDCGAAPGSWTQVALERVAEKGTVISIDLQKMEALDGATILDNRDFSDPETQAEIMNLLAGRLADGVMSDMAPASSGVKFLDHDRISDLCLETVKFSGGVLKKGGFLLCKIWQGGQQMRVENIMNQLFTSVEVVKPKASRTDSAELYLLSRNFSGDRLA